VVVALLVNSLDNATEVPSIHLPHEGGDVAMIEVAREQNSLELIGLDKLPGPAMGKPDDDALGIRVGKKRVKLHWKGGFPLGISPPGSGIGIDISRGYTGVIVVEILLDGVDHLGIGSGRSSYWGTGTAGRCTVSRRLGGCCGSHSSGIQAGEGTCTAGRRHEGGEVVEIDVAWKTHVGEAK